MHTRIIDTHNRKDVRKFINLPFDLYKNCAQWVPPFISDMELVLNRSKHPFYQHSEADFILVESEGQILGRIAVLHNRNYSNYHHQPTAFFISLMLLKINKSPNLYFRLPLIGRKNVN